jgi:alkaline phosphatase D
MKRRDFLKLTGTFVATATLTGLPGCGDDDGPDALPDAQNTGLVKFPQGLASGDPRESQVVLWTRAVPASGTGDVALTVEVATDPGFDQVVVSQAISATSASDHTVRVVVTGLAADTAYHYRFRAGADQIVGRTRTAPPAGADVPVRLAWVSCQEYHSGLYHAYRQMIADDEARPEAERIRFVLHLGDFIYETLGGQFQVPIDDNLAPTTIQNPDGKPRTIAPFPSGGGEAGGDGTFARTLDDYRHLYKAYASDPDLMAARARWPFVHTWDDHEFTNDSWQSQANYVGVGSLDEPAQRRKVAANQAFFEFVPMLLTGTAGVPGVSQDAHDFVAAQVADAPFTPPSDDNFVTEPNNVAAVGSLTIYRSLRFGKHVEVVVTDQRSYRSDHAIPEEDAQSFEFFDPRNAIPADDVAILDAGKTANGGNPPATVGISGYPNRRATSPVGTMLGAKQKAWWKATMLGSDATWKVWANEVPFMRFGIKAVGSLIVERIMDGDAWDGYPSEQKELAAYLRDEDIDNVVILTGDIHAHFAGVVYDDYKAVQPAPVGVELCAAGVASNSLFSFFESASRGAGIPADVRGMITYDASAAGGSKFVENLNLLLLHGPKAADVMAQTNDFTQAMAAFDPGANPHIKYADVNAQGYGTALVTAATVDATLVTVARPLGGAGAVLRTARFVVPTKNPGGMSGPTFTGTPPFPFKT